jgi:hypothetical protein
MKGRTTANQAREEAFRDACRDVCMYCGQRVPGYTAAEGPNNAGNFVHRDTATTRVPRNELCIASAVWARINYEKKFGPIYAELALMTLDDVLGSLTDALCDLLHVHSKKACKGSTPGDASDCTCLLAKGINRIRRITREVQLTAELKRLRSE